MSYPSPELYALEAGPPPYIDSAQDLRPSDPPHDVATAASGLYGVPDDAALRSHLMRGFDGLAAVNADTRDIPPPSLHSGAWRVPGDVAGPAATAVPHPTRSPQSRGKGSRACDECRRKKIRCDAADDTGRVACMPCSRIGARCRFSREPMKRGPSKGYIKNLAERLNTLEQQTKAPGPEQEVRRGDVEMRGDMQENSYGDGEAVSLVDSRMGDKRKRRDTGSSPGGRVGDGESLQQHMSPFLTQPQSRGGATAEAQPFWRHGERSNRQETTELPYGVNYTTSIINFDWDESVVNEYYRIIHPTFPMLPTTKIRLRQRLSECPPTLREAFLGALDCLMRSFPTATLPANVDHPQARKRAAELLAQYPFDRPSEQTHATDLVYLQTLLFMALECDNHGPSSICGQAGASRAEWLGRAAGVAGRLEINTTHETSQSVLVGDRDSEERLARRVWWVLFILDRWHASSTADLLKLPENSVVLLPEDQILLGESLYHLARLSFVVGHLSSILTTTKTPRTDVMAPSNPASSLLILTLSGEIDRFRESVESVWGSLNLVHLSYHHCHLLIKRLSANTHPTALVGHAVKIAAVLNSPATPVTPLNHHFGALCAMTLCELYDAPGTSRPEICAGLRHLSSALGQGRGLAGKKDSEGWDGAIRELVVGKLERMGGLADTESWEGDVDATRPFDARMLTRHGYLNVLGKGLFRTM